MDNNNKTKLYEGIRAGDLEYLVSSYLSIDQYSTKINSDNIVISMFVKEEEAAHDLMEFLSKNFFDTIQDIEISPTKTVNSDFQLYIEMNRCLSFPVRLIKILESITLLTGIDKWVFKTKHTPKTLDLTKENLKKYVRLKRLFERLSNGHVRVDIYGQRRDFDMIEISEEKYLDAIADAAGDFNSVPTIEYNSIQKARPADDIVLAKGVIYLKNNNRYYKLVEVGSED